VPKQFRKIVQIFFRAGVTSEIAPEVTQVGQSWHRQERAINVYSRECSCMVVGMDSTTQTLAFNAFNELLKHIVIEIVEGIDVTELVEPKLAYTPDEVADLAGFKNGIAVIREAQAGRLLGTKVRGNRRFTRQQILDYLQDNEVTV
jgi:hypothetical protein